jgi:hypothetical protein
MKIYLTLFAAFFFCLNVFGQAPVFDTEAYQKALWMTTRYYGSQRMGGGTNWLVWDITFQTSDAPDSIKKKILKVSDITLGKSFVKDKDEKYDLTGGWSDGRTGVLDGRTFFYSAYLLLLAYSEFTEGFDDLYSQEYSGYIISGKFNWEAAKGKPDGVPDVLNECKYATDFIQKAVRDANTFYYYKGDSAAGAKTWCTTVLKSAFRKSDGGESDTSRNMYSASSNVTSMSALAGAALAAMSRLYKFDEVYASDCLRKAKTAYSFATGTEMGNLTKERFYPDLTILCAELYRATGDKTYMDKCDEYMAHWIDGCFGHRMLNCYDTEEIALYAYCAASQEGAYYEKAKEALGKIVNSYLSAGNLIMSDDETAPLKYASGGAFAWSLYSKLTGEKSLNPKVVKTVDYILGDNSEDYSFIAGFGDNCPQKPLMPDYFRSDSGDPEAAFESGRNAKYLQAGILTGGTFSFSDYNDSFTDPRSQCGIDYNAPLVGALAYITSKISPVDNSKVTLRMVTMKKQPSKKVYEVGEELDASDGIITAVYSDGTTQDVKVSNSMITNFSSEKGGKYALKISYLGKYVTYPIEVVKKETGIRLSKMPRTEYFLGEEFAADGVNVQLVYNDQSFDEVPLEADMMSEFSSAQPGKYPLTVTYKDWTAEIEITILASTIKKADFYRVPSKTVYQQFESLDVSGGKIHLVYDDETEDVLDITAQMVEGFDSSLPGKETLTVRYFSKTFEYEIEILKAETPVNENVFSSVKIFSFGHTIYLENVSGRTEVFDAAGRKVFSGIDIREINILKSGIYIVKSGKITKKVVISY